MGEQVPTNSITRSARPGALGPKNPHRSNCMALRNDYPWATLRHATAHSVLSGGPLVDGFAVAVDISSGRT